MQHHRCCVLSCGTAGGRRGAGGICDAYWVSQHCRAAITSRLHITYLQTVHTSRLRHSFKHKWLHAIHCIITPYAMHLAPSHHAPLAKCITYPEISIAVSCIYTPPMLASNKSTLYVLLLYLTVKCSQSPSWAPASKAKGGSPMV